MGSGFLNSFFYRFIVFIIRSFLESEVGLFGYMEVFVLWEEVIYFSYVEVIKVVLCISL